MVKIVPETTTRWSKTHEKVGQTGLLDLFQASMAKKIFFSRH
jgi:hypothetical protein